jgi:hypothetical protein
MTFDPRGRGASASKPFFKISSLRILGAACLCLLASGCGVGTGTMSPTVSGMAMRGRVRGGQQPVSGAKVYLFAAGTTGYQSAPASLLQGSGVTTDRSGNGYVTTDATGTFTITGDYTCPSASSQIYAQAFGGNPGLAGSVNNTSLALMAVVGACGSLTSATFIGVDEQTTVAAVYALARRLRWWLRFQWLFGTTSLGCGLRWKLVLGGCQTLKNKGWLCSDGS